MPDDQIAGLDPECDADTVEGVEIDTCRATCIQGMRSVVGDAGTLRQRFDRQTLFSRKFSNPQPGRHRALLIGCLCIHCILQ
jgi:hypothetical protein